MLSAYYVPNSALGMADTKKMSDLFWRSYTEKTESNNQK